MKILARYLFGNLTRPMLYLTVAFTLLFIVGDLMDNASDFLGAGTTPLELGYYYALRLPSMVIMIVPLCLLLAVLYSLSTLTRHSEITAMRASGISIYRIVRPYLLMGILCLAFTAAVNEYTGPKFAYRADQFVDNQVHSSDQVYYEQIAFKNPSAGHIWYINQFDTRDYTMMNIELTQQREDGSDLLKYNAKKARWMDGRWWFENGTVRNTTNGATAWALPNPSKPWKCGTCRKSPRISWARSRIPPTNPPPSYGNISRPTSFSRPKHSPNTKSTSTTASPCPSSASSSS